MYILLLVSILLLYLISSFSFLNGKPTCNNFVINNYLYLAFSICLLGLIIELFHRHVLHGETRYIALVKKMAPLLLPVFIVSLVIIFFISTRPTFDTKASNVLTNHLLWLTFIFMMSVILIPRVVADETNKYVNDAIMLTALIFVIMSSAVYLFPKFFSESFSFMYPALFVALIAIILFEVMNMFTYENIASFTQTRRIISYAVILVFSLYISYDTTEMIHLSKLCVKYPNYPKTSVMFFLDIINIFSRILFLKSSR